MISLETMSNEDVVKAIQEGELSYKDGMETLYNQNFRLLYKIADKYRAYAEFDDLIQEAYLGLCEAVKRYDPDAGTKFSTYAFQWIRQCITRYIGNNRCVVRIPEHRQMLIIEYRKLLERYGRQYNRKPSVKEVAISLKIPLDHVKQLEKDCAYVMAKSLDELVAGADDENMRIADTIKADIDLENEVIDNIVNQRFSNEFWGIVRDKLDDQEENVITERYINNRTRSELVDIMKQRHENDYTASKARKIEERALYKLEHSNFARILKERFDIAISRAYRGGFWSENIMYSPTEAAAFKDMGIKV